jgi:polymorphic toxin system DSP-PTPase phosphatase-like protein
MGPSKGSDFDPVAVLSPGILMSGGAERAATASLRWSRWSRPRKTRRHPALRRAATIALVLLVLASVGTFCWAWGSAPINLRERIFPTNLAVVEAGWLYRSGQIRPNLIEGTLRNLHINLIIDLTEDLGSRDERQVAEKHAVKELGIEVLRFPMNGTGIGTVDKYAAAIEAIVRAGREGRHVLVHCAAGDRRTGGVLATYQLLVKGASPEDARAELERFSRERGVESLVLQFLRENLDDIAVRLVEIGVIERVPDPIPSFPLSTES